MLVQQLLNGISLGMVYTLLAAGFSMIFGVLELINFGYGAIYAFGAMMVWVGVSFLNWNVWVALIVSIIITGLLHILVYKVGLEPLQKKNSPVIISLITTIGLSYIIQNCLTVAFGSQRQRFNPVLDFGSFMVGNTQITSQQLLVTGVSILVLIGLYLILNKTKMGLGMRAIGENMKAAAVNGVNVNVIIIFTFFLCGVVAAISGTLIGGYYKLVSPDMGYTTGMMAFAAAVVGGMGSLPGALVGGLVMGLSQSLSEIFFGGANADAFAYIVLFVVLIIKPSGLLGKKGISRV